MGNIRLGFVRADTHAMYYGIMLQECDALLLQKTNYVVHHYAGNIYDPKVMTMPRVAGFEIAGIYDYEFDNAKAFSDIFHGKPVAYQNLEEMTEGVDAVFIADCDGGGGDHLKLATPFLKKGIPTFVDKPFALTLEDAVAIVKLAKENDTLMFNSSILTYVPAAAHFRDRYQEFTDTYWPIPADESRDVKLGLIKGVGGAFSQELSGTAPAAGLEGRMAYIIHGVALAFHLFGNGVEWVEAMGEQPLEYFHLHLTSGVDVMILNNSTEVFPETCTFYASAFGKFGVIHSGPIGDPEFLGGAAKILEIFREMIQTKKAPKDYDLFVEPIAVIEAGQLAQKEGHRVYLKDVWKK